MAAKPGRLSIAGVTIVLLLSIIAQSHLSGRGKVVETFSYDDPEIRITSPNQSIHSIPNLEINDFILASPPLPDGLRIIQNSSTLFGNVIDSYGQRTCAISPSVGINCWEFSEGEINIIDGLGNGSRIFGSVGVGRNHTCAVESKECRKPVILLGRKHQRTGRRYQSSIPSWAGGNYSSRSSILEKTIAGSDHSCGLDIYGGVYCWGNGAYGQLGRLEQALSRQPVKIGFGVGSTVDRGQEKITDISSGSFHICATSSLSKIYCWGWNGLGQLGLGFYSNSHIPMGSTYLLALLSAKYC